ncbi:hypothetical protein F5Y10DRAFT_245560 [Nemania abortiva]|nr:hypothetical protein F5Y10DRAFT_245560 [Nemania abortiva]
MAIVNGIGSILHAIISGIVAFFDIIISFLSCGYCGGRRRRMGGSRMSHRRHHATTTSRI